MAEAIVSGSIENGGSPKAPGSPILDAKDMGDTTAGRPASASPSSTTSSPLSLRMDKTNSASKIGVGPPPPTTSVSVVSAATAHVPPKLELVADRAPSSRPCQLGAGFGVAASTGVAGEAVNGSVAATESESHPTSPDAASSTSAGPVGEIAPPEGQEEALLGVPSAPPQEPAASSVLSPRPAPTNLPCMRAQLVVGADGAHTMAGKWGMTSAAHDLEGQTSPFELKLPAPKAGLPPHPPRASGLYSGFFMLQQQGGKPALSVAEKNVQLTLTVNESGGHSVKGSGKNRFGSFTVIGTIGQDGAVELFRAYIPKPVAVSGAVGRKRSNPAVAKIPAAQKARTGSLQIEGSLASSLPSADAPGLGSPRGGGKTIQSLATSASGSDTAETVNLVGRSKRATAGDWKDKADIPVSREVVPQRAPERKGKGKEHVPTVAIPTGGVSGEESGLVGLPGVGVQLPSSLAVGGESKAGRVRKLPAHLQESPEGKQLVRLNEHMRKCMAVLKELQRMPSAVWFALPVDWRALNLVDYPSVIKKPMDFSTVKSNIETGTVSAPEEFRDAMLLVFRNATAYNTKKDAPVHLAAVELKSAFEEKYRNQIESLGPLKDLQAEKEAETERKAAVASRSKKTAAGSGAGGLSGTNGGKSGDKASRGKAMPRARSEANLGASSRSKGGGGSEVGGGMIPEAQYMALKQQMELMQQQLQELKRQTSQTDVNLSAQLQAQEANRAALGSKGGGGRGRSDDSRPLSEAEKEALKAGINNLAEDKLHRVVGIIKERSPDMGGDDGGDIEVDLDALDAPTLRHLQRYVKSCATRKRKKTSESDGRGGGLSMLHGTVTSPGLPDQLDMDDHALEDHVLMFDGDAKRARDEDLLAGELPFSQSDFPDGV